MSGFRSRLVGVVVAIAFVFTLATPFAPAGAQSEEAPEVATEDVLVLSDSGEISAFGMSSGTRWVVSSNDLYSDDAIAGGQMVAHIDRESAGDSSGLLVTTTIDGSSRVEHAQLSDHTQLGWTEGYQAVVFDAQPSASVNNEIVASEVVDGAPQQSVLVASEHDLRLISAENGFLSYKETRSSDDLDLVIVRLSDNAVVYRQPFGPPGSRSAEVAFSRNAVAFVRQGALLHLVDFTNGSEEQLIHGGAAAGRISISPDGTFLAFDVTPSMGGDAHFYLQRQFDLDTRVSLESEADDSFVLHVARFAPDGDQVVVGPRSRAAGDVRVFDVDGSSVSLNIVAALIAVLADVPVPAELAEVEVSDPQLAETNADMSDGAETREEDSAPEDYGELLDEILAGPADDELVSLLSELSEEDHQALIDEYEARQEVAAAAYAAENLGYVVPITGNRDEDSILDSRGGRRLVFGLPIMFIAWLVRAGRESNAG